MQCRSIDREPRGWEPRATHLHGSSTDSAEASMVEAPVLRGLKTTSPPLALHGTDLALSLSEVVCEL